MNILKQLPFILLFVLAFSACKKDNETKTDPEPDFEQVNEFVKKYKNGVVEFTNYLVDTTRRPSRVRDYFNFDKAEFISADKINTDEWDVVFLYGLDIHPNNGVISDSSLPWYGNNTNGRVSGVIKAFDEVNEVPANTVYEDHTNNLTYAQVNDQNAKDSWIYWGYAVNDMDTGLPLYYVPYKSKTAIWKLNDGRFVKFEYINLYNNKPEENSLSSRRGYLSFRYFVGKAGSKDLKTK